MLVDTFLYHINLRMKNKAAFKPPNRKPKVKNKEWNKQIDAAFKRLTKADLLKYFNDEHT